MDDETPQKDRDWYADLLENNIIKKKNNLNGEVIDGINWPVVREEVAKKHFPDISETKKKEKKQDSKGNKNKKPTDVIKALRNKGKKAE